jgi:hypothetical protein
VGIVKDKYFRTKYRPASLLLNVNAIIYFKFKLNLKLGNKNYSSIIVISIHVYAKRGIKFQIKI